ncbi:MAG: hypothetical protein DRI48_10890 [Chloroflexi bacterium]|nr:MAG: hypothetical protein DRI48_10890 [Chloroflexota bacterium]
MCQQIGKCFVEDPFAKEKDTIWEARWFVKNHPSGSYEELMEHLKSRRAFIDPTVLKEIVSNGLRSLEQEKHATVDPRQEYYKKILSLLPS